MTHLLAIPAAWAHFADLARLTSIALIAAVWQGILLAAAAALVLRLIPRIPAAARFAIWFAVFALIAALPFLGMAPHAATSIAAPASARAWLLLDSRWTLAIAAVWAAASLLRAATLVVAALRVRTLSRSATPIAHPQDLTADTARRAQLCSSTRVDRPTVIGFFSPKILIPAWLLEKLTPQELHHVVLHEAGHLNRADDWLNLLQKLALVLFPLNPALAWVERRLCFERELACDERVLTALAAREQQREDQSDLAATGYASSLATLAEYRLQRRGLVRNLALALGALGSSNASAPQSELGRRIARILRPIRAMRPLHVRLATGCAIVALLFSTAELERCPQVVSFAPASLVSPAPTVQLAATESTQPRLLPNYRAVAARITLPAAPRIKSIGDAAPRLAAQHRVAASVPRAIAVRAVRTQHPPAARLISVDQPAPQPNFVITRYTVTAWPAANGYRIVRTTAIYTAEPQPATYTDSPAPPHSSNASVSSTASRPNPPARRAQQIAQPVSPYAAVPVPGGWLVFQL